MIRSLAVFALLLCADFTYAGEVCPFDDLKERPYSDAECQFYLGTTAYRAQLYSVAAAHWSAVVDPEMTSAETSSIRTTALSTLSYLRYYGLGIEQDKSRAVSDWKRAAGDGSMEAHSQLGHAYNDKEFLRFSPITSLAWYQAALIRFADSEDLDETEQGILAEIDMSATELAAVLSDKDKEEARELAIAFSQKR